MGAIIPRPRAGSSPVGWAVIIPDSTARAIQAIQGEAIAEAAPMGEAAMAEGEVAINPSPAPTTRSVLVRRERGFRFIPICIRTSLESLQKEPFLFASVHHFQSR